MKKAYLSIFLCLILFSACATRIRIETFDAKTYAQFDYKELIKLIKTPEQAAHYLKTYLRFVDTNTWRSFKYIHQRRTAICAEYAFAAAALLSDNGYPELILHMYFLGTSDTHACYIYQDRKTRKWGTLGVYGESSSGAIFNNLEEACHFIKNSGHPEPIRAYKVHYLGNFNIIDSPEEKIYYDEWEKRGKEVRIEIR